jgi:hypothetical protein
MNLHHTAAAFGLFRYFASLRRAISVDAERHGDIWVIRIEDDTKTERIQEYADRELPVAFAMAERVHGPEIADVLAAKVMKEKAA